MIIDQDNSLSCFSWKPRNYKCCQNENIKVVFESIGHQVENDFKFYENETNQEFGKLIESGLFVLAGHDIDTDSKIRENETDQELWEFIKSNLFQNAEITKIVSRKKLSYPWMQTENTTSNIIYGNVEILKFNNVCSFDVEANIKGFIDVLFGRI